MTKIPDYISKSNKSQDLKNIINEALYILENLGIPLPNQTQRRLERIAMAFLAVCNVKKSQEWSSLKKYDSVYAVRTRDIIRFWNTYFDENVSESSYDDIRRKDLQLLVLSEIVIPSATNPNSARNDGTRGFALNPDYLEIIFAFGGDDWELKVNNFMSKRKTVQSKLHSQRNLPLIPVTFPSGKQIQLSIGGHNELQKAIIEKFLPRYGYGAEILYVGDTADKFLHIERERLQELNFFELSHGELPDLVVYSQQKNWLYLIEAVYSSGVISDVRLHKLKELTAQCNLDVIFITAFLDRKTFRKFVADIAWETEVWIAEEPDHLIHFDGEKFLGSYPPKKLIIPN
jgi:BsuBI/PstI restriction endonuclease domain/BsuBI/PstI restriction endonuclease HTH domain